MAYIIYGPNSFILRAVAIWRRAKPILCSTGRNSLDHFFRCCLELILRRPNQCMRLYNVYCAECKQIHITYITILLIRSSALHCCARHRSRGQYIHANAKITRADEAGRAIHARSPIEPRTKSHIATRGPKMPSRSCRAHHAHHPISGRWMGL